MTTVPSPQALALDDAVIISNARDHSRSLPTLVLRLGCAMLAGGVMMSLELVAFRLYAPYFGYSIYVWGSMISVVMAALAVGYSLGGRLADRFPTDRPFYGAILASAFYQLLVLFAVRRLLPPLAQRGEFTGAVLATLIVFAPSMIALAATGPIVVRLCSRAGKVGSAAGMVYALSTIGGMAGILATSFFFLPQFGTQATLKLLCAASLFVGASGLAMRKRTAILAFIAIPFLFLLPDLGWSQGAVWTTESAYNLVRVVRRGPQWLLQLNHQSSIHTIREEAGPWTSYYYDSFALGPLLVPANRLLVLGMGAGASIRATRVTAPKIEIDAVEIDPKVVEAAVRWFGVNPGEPRLRIHVADARPWLARDRGTYDLVHVDLYQGGPYVPFYLVTEEFFRLARARMTQDGLLMMNVFDAGRDRELLHTIGATLRHVFPSVMVLPAGGDNHMVLAFTRNEPLDSVRGRVATAPLDSGLRRVEINELTTPHNTPVFTDDHAPVEEITRRMLLGGG